MHNASPFNSLWLTEVLRLQETRDGPLEDQTETQAAQHAGGDFNARILKRAQLLGIREGLHERLQQWRRVSKLLFWALCILAIMSGAGMALGALGDGSRPVNLAQGLVVVLGLNSLMFLFWLIALLLPGTQPSGLGGVWLWLTARLSRAPEQALVGQALLSLLQRACAIKPLLGSLTHTLWSLALATAVITLLGVLSASQYSFRWETTLLSPDFFVSLTQALGWLPSLMGFAQPSADIIAQSVSPSSALMSESSGPMWSQWLVGCVITYGVLPRLLALLGCLLLTRYKLKHYRFDAHLPGLAELRPRLMPDSRSTGIDAPAPRLEMSAKINQSAVKPYPGGMNAFAGLELANDIEWPPDALMDLGADLGRIDTRSQRHQLEDRLKSSAFEHLIIVCDGRQTPDRGTVQYLKSLTRLCTHLHIIILPPARNDEPHRATLWQSELERMGLDPANTHIGMAQFLS